MANYFRRRRPHASPNKNEEKVRRELAQKNLARSAVTLAGQYPGVAKLSLDVKFLSAQSLILDQKTLNFLPQSACRFVFPCAGRCGKGAFDLKVIISEAVNARKNLVENSQRCRERVYAGSDETCGCEMQYKIGIAYFPKPAAGPLQGTAKTTP
ncbi:MAG: hypothetical protein HY747_11085 [Elusimicrobia bacterium]|nr:hypothetical protein [Elusimicrobiota bacterium]